MTRTIIENKKAMFDFFIQEKIEAGISLKGWEVKSLRSNRGNIKESYALIKNNEVFLIGSHISPLPNVDVNEDTEPTRTRKLLLKTKEISKISRLVTQKGYTLIPLSFYWKEGKVKVTIGLAKGRKKHDKRALLKERDWKMTQKRLVKKHYNK
jgi:SsrA-binding protein